MSSHLHYSKISWAFRVFSEILTSMVYISRLVKVKSQLDLGRNLAEDGASVDMITSALGHLSGTPVTPAAAEAGPATRLSYEGLEAQLGEIEFQRQTAESLLEHLRAEHAKAVSAAQVSEAEVVREFYAEPGVADRAADLKIAQDRFYQTSRVSRAGSDPSLVGLGKRIKELEAELGRMWQQRKAGLQARLAGAGDDQAIRQAASEVMTLRAKEAALGERLDQFKEQRLPELEAKHDRLVKQHGQAQAAALLKSIEQGLKSVEGMRAEVEQRFQNDLAESNKSEIVQLAESNLRNNLERQRALFYYYSAMSDNCRCHKSLFFRNLS